MGCIDMNAWYSRVDRPDRPDFVLFDLDPSPDVGFAETVQVALLVKEALDALRARSASRRPRRGGHARARPGRAALHVRRHAAVRRDRRAARSRARTAGLATTEWTKSKRRGVLIDSNQNGEGKTIASVYSVRPRAGAPVSTPLRWERGERAARPARFTMEVVLERVRKHGDLFDRVLKTRSSDRHRVALARRLTAA